MKRRLLLNMKLLASELGVSPVFIKRMKYAGFEMPGGVATVEWALDWLRKHPDFRQKDHLRPPRELHQDAEHLRPPDGYRCHGPYQKHAPRKPSSVAGNSLLGQAA